MHKAELMEIAKPRWWRLILTLIWAIWWGGLSFYAVVVVPVGTNLVGSIEQGFITQQVTQWHNAVSVLFVFCVLTEAWRTRRRSLWMISLALAVIDIALLAWHARLSGRMDFHDHTLVSGFYAEHAVYLWITAIEWVLGLTIPVWLMAPVVLDVKLPVR